MGPGAQVVIGTFYVREVFSQDMDQIHVSLLSVPVDQCFPLSRFLPDDLIMNHSFHRHQHSDPYISTGVINFMPCAALFLFLVICCSSSMLYSIFQTLLNAAS